MERKKSLSSSSAQKTRTSLVVCFRGERESHAHQRRVFEVVRCVAHPRFGFAWSRDLLVVPNAAKNTGNVTTTVGLSRCCVCVLRIEMIAKISPPPFFCVCGSRHDDAVSKRGESSLFEDETERQLFDHHHRHHETTKGGFSRASFSFVVVVVVVVVVYVVVRDYTRRRRSFSTLMRRKKWFWFFVSQSLFATKKIERKKAFKKNQ